MNSGSIFPCRRRSGYETRSNRQNRPCCVGGGRSGQSGRLPGASYTFVTGDPTPEILKALGASRELEGIEAKALAVPQEVLMREPYVLSLSTGSTAIDAYLLDAPWVKSYSATNWLAPIAGGETGEAENEFDLSPFRKELLDVTTYTQNGRRLVLAVPFHTKGNLLFYRKDLLEAAGFEPPRNWTELFSQCESILATKGESSENWDEKLRWGFIFHSSLFINDFYPIMWGFGGGIFDDSEALAVNRAENVRALALIKQMLGRISPTPEEMAEVGLFDDYHAPENLFAGGAAIFMINWNTRWRDLENGLPGQVIDISQVGVAPIPAEDGSRGFSNIGSFCWGINYYSRHREAARDGRRSTAENCRRAGMFSTTPRWRLKRRHYLRWRGCSNGCGCAPGHIKGKSTRSSTQRCSRRSEVNLTHSKR